MDEKEIKFNELGIEELSNRISLGVIPEKECFRTKIYSYDASLGKTYTTIQTLVHMFKDNTLKRTLIVTKLVSEGMILANDINKGADKDIAFAYNGMTKTFNKEENVLKCKNSTILILTHRMYIELCLKQDGHYLYEALDDRKLIIIDEQLDAVSASFKSLNNNEIHIIQDVLQNSIGLLNKFNDIMKDIIDTLAKPSGRIKRVYFESEQQSKGIFNDEYINKTELAIQNIINHLDIEFITSSLSDKERYINQEYLDKINKINVNYKLTVKGVYDILAKILDFFDNDNVLYDFTAIYTYDPSFKYILFENSIMLDASANFDYLYQLNSDLFDVVYTPRIINHSNCLARIYDVNSSTSKKNTDKYFKKRITDYIIRQIQEDYYSKEKDKILFISNKNEIEDLVDVNKEYLGTILENNKSEENKKPKHNDERLQGWKLKSNQDKIIDDKDNKENKDSNLEDNIAVLNYMNMRGVNTCKDYNIIYTLQAPRMPFPYYIFIYEYYTGTRLTESDMELNNRTVQHGVSYTFKHKELSKLYLSMQASTLYQALKRVSRIREPKCELNILFNDKEVISMVLNQMPNINVEVLEEQEFEGLCKKKKARKKREQKDYDSSNRKENSQLKKLIDLIGSKEIGEYLKKDIREELGISDKGQFGNIIKEYKLYLLENNITNIIINTRKIITS